MHFRSFLRFNVQNGNNWFFNDFGGIPFILYKRIKKKMRIPAPSPVTFNVDSLGLSCDMPSN